MLTVEQRALLSTLRAAGANKKFNIPENVDCKLLFAESIHQAVTLLSLQGVDENSLSKTVKDKWQSYAMWSLKSNASIHIQHAYLHSLMNEIKLPYVILKGSVSAYYYSDPLMRAMGDVDFLIDEKDVEAVDKFLRSKGFICEEDKHICHFVYKKDRVHLEMHFAPAGMPDGKAGDIIKGYLSDVFEKSKIVEVGGNKFVKPSDFHHGLILLMHTYHHLLSEGIGLRHLYDWAMFINSYKGETFAEEFRDKLSAVGLWNFAQILSYISYKYLGVDKAQWMGEQEELFCEQVMDDIFSGGNFGSKDKNRSVEGMSISNRGKNGLGSSKFIQLISSAHKAGQVRYPKMAKIPVIKYFCIIPLGFRYIFRVITGKRKRLKFMGSMKQAEKRKQLYKNFHLFEIE